MTGFKPGDRVRFAGTVDSVFPENTFEVRVERDDHYWFFIADNLELVTPAPPESQFNMPQEVQRLLREKYDLQKELAEFKARVVEVLDIWIHNINNREAIKQHLGLTPKASRYRVMFEVEAESDQEAVDKAHDKYVESHADRLQGATVEKIKEES